MKTLFMIAISAGALVLSSCATIGGSCCGKGGKCCKKACASECSSKSCCGEVTYNTNKHDCCAGGFLGAIGTCS